MFIDIHSHILPGLDDGALDMETSLEMLRLAASENPEGVLLATPHFINGELFHTPEEIALGCLELMKAAAEQDINLRILPGSEVFICPELPELVENGQVATLNNSSYILVELPMMSIPVYTSDVFYKLRLMGYNPIIAHPERNTEIRRNPEILYEFLSKGLYSQVNASSLKGIYGRDVRYCALTLIKHNLIHFVASDAHTYYGRSPKLRNAYELVSEEAGEEMADRLFNLNGQVLLQNRTIEMPEPIKVASYRKCKSYFINPIFKFLTR